MSTVCNQVMVGGLWGCWLKQEGVDTRRLSHLACQLCPAAWQVGQMAGHRCRQITQELRPSWLAACPMLWSRLLNNVSRKFHLEANMELSTWVSAKAPATQVKKVPRGVRSMALWAPLMSVLVRADASWQLVKRGQHCFLVLGIPEGRDLGYGKAEAAAWWGNVSSGSWIPAWRWH